MNKNIFFLYTQYFDLIPWIIFKQNFYKKILREKESYMPVKVGKQDKILSIK